MDSIKNIAAGIGTQMTIALLALSLIVAGIAASPAPVSADEPEAVRLAANNGHETSVTKFMDGAFDEDKASFFETGDNPLGYVVTSVKINMGSAHDEGDEMVTVKLYGDSGNGYPTETSIHEFQSPETMPYGKKRRVTFTATSELVLEPNTKYWLAVEGEVGIMLICFTEEADQAERDGWQIGNENVSRMTPATNWPTSADEGSLMYKVTGYPIPDMTHPTIESAEVSEDGTEIDVEYSEALDLSNLPAADEFGITSNGFNVRISDVTSDDDTTLTLTTEQTIKKKNIRLSYSGKSVQDEWGNLAGIVNKITVANRSDATPQPVVMASNMGKGVKTTIKLVRGKKIGFSFKTGPGAKVELKEIVVRFRHWHADGTIVATLNKVKVNGAPDEKVVDLRSPAASAGEKAFTPKSNVKLKANTDYMILLTRSEDDEEGNIELPNTYADSEDSITKEGWSIWNWLAMKNPDSHWERMTNGMGKIKVVAKSSAEVKVSPLTAQFMEFPASHNGDTFSTQIHFSEALGVSYVDMRDHVFSVKGGTLETASRHDGQDHRWVLQVTPNGNGPVVISLPASTSCNKDADVCTSYGKALSHSVSLTVE